jgi:hypothetical protein
MGRKLGRAALALVVLVVVQPDTLLAQAGRAEPPPDWRSNTTVGIGYMANAPRALIGGTVYVVTPVLGGMGVFGGFRLTHHRYGSDELFRDDITVPEAEARGHFFIQQVEHWRVVNFGLLRAVTNELIVYAGAGFAQETAYDEFHDETEQEGFFGSYRLENPEFSGNRVNVTGGGIFRIGRLLALHFGAEVAPVGFTVGGSLLLPVGRTGGR